MPSAARPEPTGNVVIVEKQYAAFAARDINAILAALAEDVIWQEPVNPWNPPAGTRRGRAGFLDWARIGAASEEILVLAPRDFLANANMVAVVGFTECRVKATGKSYATDFVHLITLDDGKVTRFQEFFDTFAAAAAFRNDQSF